MRIKMLDAQSTPDFIRAVGDEVDVEIDEARALVAGGHAVPLEPFPRPEVETATTPLLAVERAVSRRKKAE